MVDEDALATLAPLLTRRCSLNDGDGVTRGKRGKSESLRALVDSGADAKRTKEEVSAATGLSRKQYEVVVLSKLARLNDAKVTWNPVTYLAIAKFKARLIRFRETRSDSPEPASSSNSKQDAPSKAKRKIKAKNDYTLLKQRLDYLGLSEMVVCGDGNCQFRSMSQELFGSDG